MAKNFKCRNLVISNEEREFVNISFTIDRSLALVGESGSGKSLTLKALLGMLPAGFVSELECESDFELMRGETIAYVPQNPFTALSPLTKIKDQWIRNVDRSAQMISQVGLDKDILTRFASELSGGQLQRVIIAMALATRPHLMLLDEPTTALDASLRKVVIDLLLKLSDEFGFKMLFVTHDISSASLLCEEIAVIQKGKIVESGLMENVLKTPKEAYTKALIEANFAHREFRR